MQKVGAISLVECLGVRLLYLSMDSVLFGLIELAKTSPNRDSTTSSSSTGMRTTLSPPSCLFKIVTTT